MNTTRHMLLTAALAGSLTLAACSDEAPDPPSPSSSGPVGESSPAGETSPSGSPSSEPTDAEPSEDPSSSASPSDAGASPSPSSPAPSGSGSAAPSPSDGGSPSPSDGASSPSEDAAGLPPMPPVAKENSEEGAEAFARWYVETLNHLYQHPQTGILDKYAGDNCKTCAKYERNIVRYVKEGRHTASSPIEIRGARVDVADAPAEVEVIVVVDQLPVRFVNAEGATVDTLSAINGMGLRINMLYEGGWKISSIPVDPTAGEWVELD